MAHGSVGLGCVVASSGPPKQGHHMFSSAPSSVCQVSLSQKFPSFKKFANEYVKYSTAKGQDGWKKHSCIFQLCKLFFSGALWPESVLSNSVRRGVIQGHSAQLGATQDSVALFRATLRNLEPFRYTSISNIISAEPFGGQFSWTNVSLRLVSLSSLVHLNWFFWSLLE